MTDEIKSNTVILNIGLHGNGEKPEPDISPVFIDGLPIHNVVAISVSSASSEYTTIHLVFHAKVGGFKSEPVKCSL